MPNQKDITEKMLESCNDVFADILNVALFQGKEVVKETDLETAISKSQFRMLDGDVHEQERDVAKFWKIGDVRIALCGLENQTEPDKDMALRIISYDGAVYKDQVKQHISARNSNSKEEAYPVYPAITLVLYFGKGKWTAPKTLYDCFEVEIPPELKEYISDYKINVVELAQMTPEQIESFKSDFYYVVCHLKDPDSVFQGDPERKIRHVDETTKLLAALAGDARIEKAGQDLLAEGKENVRMCDVLDRVVNRALAEDRAAMQKVLDEKDQALAEKDRRIAELENLISKQSQHPTRS